MQSTTNAFQDGITTDLHPLNMPETALTSALNATVFTGNGNEGLLQNDMGNTLIKDSITGSIMALNDGFIPLGMKEHGGILYIASYNPATKEGELGSIPSPIIRYTINGFTSDSSRSSVLISDLGEAEDTTEKPFIYTASTSNEEITPRLYTNTLLILNDYIFHCGDKFVLQLNLNLQENPSVTERHQTSTDGSTTIKYPQITKYINHDDGSYDTLKGWFRIELYAVLENGSEIQLTDLEDPQWYYNSQTGVTDVSDYWFLKGSCDFDPVATRAADMYRTYPNIPAGRLAIKVVPEYPSQLEYLYNSTYDSNLPQVYAYEDEREGEEGNSEIHRYVIVPGYTFSADCPIMPDMIEVICNNGEIPVYTGENESLKDIPDNCILVKSSLNPESETVTITDTVGETKTVPYSNRNSTYAKPKLAYKSYDSESETYTISKYLLPGSDKCSYATNLIKNYSLQDHNGLFWVEIPDWNIELEFTLKLYTKGFSGYIKDGVQKNTYVLYTTQTFPKFNPAEAELKNKSSLLDGAFVNQYYKFGHEDYETFDLPLFEHSGQKCFLYGDEGGNENILFDYDPNSEKYVPFKTPGGDFISIYDAKNLTKKIYPQMVREYNASDRDKEDGTRFIWNQIPLGYRNMPSKEFFEEIKKLGTQWSKEHYVNEYDTSETKDIDWEWFVESTDIPSIQIQQNGSDPETRNCLLPIRRNKVPSSATPSEYCHYILEAARQQRNYFKNKPDRYGFTIDTLKKYCLYKTNLDVSKSESISWGEFSANFPHPGYQANNIGAKSPQGGESQFTKEGNFLLCHSNVNGSFDILIDDRDKRQGIENINLVIPNFDDRITQYETGHRRIYQDSAHGGAEHDDLTQSMMNDSATSHKYPGFYWYCPTVDTHNDVKSNIDKVYIRDYSNFMLDAANEYSINAMGRRSIHDSYYAHLVAGFRPFAPKYWTKDQRSNTLNQMANWDLDREITYPYHKQKSDPSTVTTYNFMWYVSGFITEAMKKCPGYVPADKQEHEILNVRVLNEKYPTSYLYNKKTKLQMHNYGYGLGVPHIPLSCTKMQGYLYSYEVWDNDDIISAPNFDIWISEKCINKSQTDTIHIGSNSKNHSSSKTLFLLSGTDTDNSGQIKEGLVFQPEIRPGDKNLPISLAIKVTPSYTYPTAESSTKSISAYTFTEELATNMPSNNAGRGVNNRVFKNYEKQWDLLNRDNCAVIASPQIFIQKDDEITRFYQSDYLLKPVLYFSGENLNTGLWQSSDEKVMWKQSNIMFDNLLSLDSRNTLSVKKPSELGYINSFQDEAQYWAASDFKSQGKVFVTDSLDPGWYVLCINYNCDSKANFTVNIGTDPNLTTTISGTFYTGYRFLPVYIEGGKQYIKLIASGTTSDTYIRNFGLYKIDVPASQPTEQFSPNQDLYSAITELQYNKTTCCTDLTDQNIQKLYRSLVFPCTLCFKENVYKGSIGDVISRDVERYDSSSSGNTSGIRSSARRIGGSSSLSSGSSITPITPDTVTSTLRTVNQFRNPGCLGQEYKGFQELPDEAYKECVIAYGLDADSITFKTYWLNPRFNNQELVENLIHPDTITIRELDPNENN